MAGKPQCHKRRYVTLELAQMALLEMRISRDLHHNQKRKEQRIYYHKLCKAWHITKVAENGNRISNGTHQ